MKRSKYWQQRFGLVEEASHKEAIKTYKEIEPSFIKAQREINAQIQVWYGRFAKNNEMTLADARKVLNANELKEFRWDVEDFIKYGKENAINQKWVKELENASAKFHITRLESLLLRNQQTMEVLFGNELDQVDQMARRIISEGYYKSIYEVQKGFGLGFNISGIDDKELNLLVSKPWAGDGKNFSSRIWQRKGQMVNDLQKELTRNLILGKAPNEAIKNLERFVDKKIKNTRNAAGRLVMTESAYFHSLSQKKAFDELDVEEYEIVATLDSRTSEICQDMDGKHFPMEDYQAGITAPPFHVYCRSTTVPYFDDEFTIGEERAARDKDGKTFYMPGDMKYKDWKKYISGEFDDLEGLYERENKYVVNNIINGTYGVEINNEKQEPHMEATAKKGKSYLFDDVDPQELFNNYAGTGIMELDRRGNKTNKEICRANRFIGINGSDGARTKVFKIHHSKKRTHIAPCLEKGVKDDN